MWKYTTNTVVIVGCIPLLESGDNKYSSPPGNFSSGLNSHFEKPATNSCYFNWALAVSDVNKQNFNWALANTDVKKQNFNWALAVTNKPLKIQISHTCPSYTLLLLNDYIASIDIARTLFRSTNENNINLSELIPRVWKTEEKAGLQVSPLTLTIRGVQSAQEVPWQESWLSGA